MSLTQTYTHNGRMDACVDGERAEKERGCLDGWMDGWMDGIPSGAMQE